MLGAEKVTPAPLQPLPSPLAPFLCALCKLSRQLEGPCTPGVPQGGKRNPPPQPPWPGVSGRLCAPAGTKRLSWTDSPDLSCQLSRFRVLMSQEAARGAEGPAGFLSRGPREDLL